MQTRPCTYSLFLAKSAARLWACDVVRVSLIGHSGNTVFRVDTRSERFILRLTDPSFRSFETCLAETRFVHRLAGRGVPVATPKATNESCLYAVELGGAIATAWRWAPGRVLDSPAEWTPEFLASWGAALAHSHLAAAGFPSDPGVPAWSNDVFFVEGAPLIASDRPGADLVMRGLNWASERVRHLPNGPIHADLGPQNFHWDGRTATLFDFGNLCTHAFVADLATALSVARRAGQNTPTVHQQIIAGYESVRSLTDEEREAIPGFIHLRSLLVWLSRVWLYAEQDGPAANQTIETLRRRAFDSLSA